eukprot:1298045-Rhodomonas_salina.2
MCCGTDCGTDGAYGATRCPVLTERMVLRDARYWPRVWCCRQARYAGTDRAYGLRARYAMSGTDVAYGATRAYQCPTTSCRVSCNDTAPFHGLRN